MITAIIITAILSAGLGILIFWLLRKLILGNKSSQILKQAEAEGENIKKEKIFQAKERFLQLKSEHEAYVNEKNAQIQHGSAWFL